MFYRCFFLCFFLFLSHHHHHNIICSFIQTLPQISEGIPESPTILYKHFHLLKMSMKIQKWEEKNFFTERVNKHWESPYIKRLRSKTWRKMVVLSHNTETGCTIEHKASSFHPVRVVMLCESAATTTKSLFLSITERGPSSKNLVKWMFLAFLKHRCKTNTDTN